MTLGIFGARSDHRGLATLTALMHRCLRPAKTVVVDMGRHSVTAFHADQYPGATTITYDDAQAGYFDLDVWLEGLETVLTFEVPYDPKLYDVCRRRGVKTVELCMPELDGRQRDPHLPRPDVIALPTSWLAERYSDAVVLPVPSDPFHVEPGKLVVHPASLAMADRNGGRVVIEASRTLPYQVVVRGQAKPELPWFNARVETADLPDSRDLYAGAACVVIPRRYGGLSLVHQEAMSVGLPLLTGEHDEYAHVLPPEARIRSERGRDLQAKGGAVLCYGCSPQDAVAKIGAVMADEGLRAELAAASRRWAELYRWEGHVKDCWASVLGAVPA